MEEVEVEEEKGKQTWVTALHFSTKHQILPPFHMYVEIFYYWITDFLFVIVVILMSSRGTVAEKTTITLTQLYSTSPLITHPLLTENIVQRVINTLKFSWVFIQSLLDDLTEGLNSFCKDNLDISKVLRFERALLSQQQKKVRGKDAKFWVLTSRWDTTVVQQRVPLILQY